MPFFEFFKCLKLQQFRSFLPLIHVDDSPLQTVVYILNLFNIKFYVLFIKLFMIYMFRPSFWCSVFKLFACVLFIVNIDKVMWCSIQNFNYSVIGLEFIYKFYFDTRNTSAVKNSLVTYINLKLYTFTEWATCNKLDFPMSSTVVLTQVEHQFDGSDDNE